MMMHRSHFVAALSIAALLCGCEIISGSAKLFGQAISAQTLGGLQVHKANYVAQSDTIIIELMNDGERAATAFQLDVAVQSGDRILKHLKYTEDHIDLLLNAPVQPNGETSWSGVIGPKGVFSESWKGNVSGANQGSTSLNVIIEGVIWSDGTIDAVNVAARNSMNSFLNSREARSRTEQKVLTILAASQADSDVRHRITSIEASLSRLQANYQTQQTALKVKSVVDASYVMDDPSELNITETNLSNLEKATDPAKALDWYQSWLTTRHSQRLALSNLASSLPH